MSNRLVMIGVGAVVLGGLSFGVYKVVQKQEATYAAPGGSAQAGSGEGALPSIKVAPTAGGEDGGTADVDKITVKNGKEPEVVLEKQGDVWVVTSPVKANANQQKVKDLVSQLKDWKIEKKVPIILYDGGLSPYELDEEHVVHVTASKGGDKKTDVLFGKTAGVGQLAMLPGSDTIYSVAGYKSFTVKIPAKDWRETEIFKLDDASVSQVSLVNKNGEWTFQKGDKGWTATLGGKPLERFDEDKIKSFIGAFGHLNAEDFGDGKKPGEVGLDAAAATVTITTNEKDKTERHVLKVGGEAPKDPAAAWKEGGHYALKDADPTIVVIPKAASEWALADRDKFTKQDADAGAGDAKDAGAPRAAKDAGKAAPAAPPPATAKGAAPTPSQPH